MSGFCLSGLCLWGSLAMLDKLPRCGKRLCFVHSRLTLAWARHTYVQLVIFIPYAPMYTHHGSTPQLAPLACPQCPQWLVLLNSVPKSTRQFNSTNVNAFPRPPMLGKVHLFHLSLSNGSMVVVAFHGGPYVSFSQS